MPNKIPVLNTSDSNFDKNSDNLSIQNRQDIDVQRQQDDIKINLLGMSRQALSDFFADMGEKPFRATQVMKWVYQYGVTDFYQMTNISKKLQDKLAKIATIQPPVVKFKKFSDDGTRKWVFEVAGGSLVETVLIPADDNKQFGRKTLCISSQVGCALDCSFCSTGKQGFERDLTAAEIYWSAMGCQSVLYARC